MDSASIWTASIALFCIVISVANYHTVNVFMYNRKRMGLVWHLLHATCNISVHYEWMQAARFNFSLLFHVKEINDSWALKLLKQRLAAIMVQKQSFKVRSHHLSLHHPKQKVLQSASITYFSNTAQFDEELFNKFVSAIQTRKNTQWCVPWAAERVQIDSENQSANETGKHWITYTQLKRNFGVLLSWDWQWLGL